MEAKEKAKELIQRFKPFVDFTNDDFDTCNIAILKNAKQCALICVSEIFLSNPHSNPFNTDIYSTLGYWRDVKEELENM